MRVRRLAGVTGMVTALVVSTAGTALAAGSPAYPPGGSVPVIRVDQTLVVVHATTTAHISYCTPGSATLTVTGPGRQPGVVGRTYPITIAPDGTASQVVQFDRVGRNTLAVVCGALSASAGVTVRQAAPVKTASTTVLGEVLGAGTSATATTAGTTAAVTGVAAALVRTGADTAPLGLAALLLALGTLLVVASRRRPVRAAHRK